MPKRSDNLVPTLASRWSLPEDAPVDDVGYPLACVATTYTFHAEFYESDLLPRFLGLKFDNTEGERAFVVEREQALGTVHACVLVDADHADVAQTSLRWDQLPVHVSGGAQHSKVTLLVWERCVRLMVGSANLTRTGYRRNREIAAVLDFFNDPTSAPRTLAEEALDFLESVTKWIRAAPEAMRRLRDTLASTRRRIRQWEHMPDSFTPRERPRATFVPGLPSSEGEAARSPMDQLLSLWGNRHAEEVAVLTPFVGETDSGADPVVRKIVEIPCRRGAMGCLVVPGVPSEAASESGVEQVTQGIAEHISAVDDDTQCQTGEDSHPGCLYHVAAGVTAEHAAPAGKRGRDAIADEADTSLCEDSAAQTHGEHDNQGSHDIGQDMPEEDGPGGTADSAGGFHIDILLDSNHGASSQT
jgi:hypothetical protein